MASFFFRENIFRMFEKKLMAQAQFVESLFLHSFAINILFLKL